MADSFEPADVELTDSIKLTPTVTLGLHQNDNIYNESADKTSSSIFTLNPNFLLGAEDGVNNFSLSYSATSGIVEKNSDDNYLDHTLLGSMHYEPNAKNRLDVNLSFNKLHEDRGTDLTEQNPNAVLTPIEYNQSLASFSYQYGALSSQARIGTEFAVKSKKYTNYLDLSESRNNNTNKIGLNFEYDLGDVTSLTFDANTTDIEYPVLGSSGISRDSKDNRFLVGLKWEGLAKTTGKAKIGYQSKSFDNSERADFSGTAIDVGFAWQPLSYSTVNFMLGRSSKDPTTDGDYIKESSLFLGWNHAWSEKIVMDLSVFLTDEEYVGNTDRQDDMAWFSSSLSYSLTRWFNVSLGYEYMDKNSTADNISFDKNAVKLMFSVGL